VTRPLLLVAALALLGCARPQAQPGPPDAGPPASAPAESAVAPLESASAEASPPLVPLDEPGRQATPGSEMAFGVPPPAAEARRATLSRIADERALAAEEARVRARYGGKLTAGHALEKGTALARIADERALATQQELVRAHFGGQLPAPLFTQTVPLLGDRRAVLLTGPAQDRNPLLLVLDAKGTLLWTKEKPLAGTRQVVTEIALAAGPRGEVAVLWYDIPTQLVALRKWSWEGVVLADFSVAEVDLCEALSALHWPGRGWLVAASAHGAARVQLLDEQGRRAFGPTGAELPWKARPAAPAALAVDDDMSAMVFQVGDLERPDRLLATRLDTLGMAIWPRVLDLGAAVGPLGERPVASRRAPGEVRVTLAHGPTAIVTSGGSILAR
jgi:hypothetical protein